MFLTKEDFQLFSQYGERSASEFPGAHQKLRKVYDKLGEIVEGVREYGYRSKIRRNPQNQGQIYESYHWSQIHPPYSKDSDGIICFVVDLTEEGLGLHIDSYQRNGHNIPEEGRSLQGWERVSVEDACKLTKEEISAYVVDYCRRHRKEFLLLGKMFGIMSCKKLLEMESYKKLLVNNKNLILTGAPGTGKTYLAKEIADSLGADESTIGFVQFHPSYDYSDFVEGLRPINKEGSKEIGFERKDGIFMSFCRQALRDLQNAKDPSNPPIYVFIIDEINRGEISKIFGELFFSIDQGYRGKNGRVSTQYSNLWTENDIFDATLKGDDQKKFYIPQNVYIIGTMNDIDRSVECMDFAMRRRFAFKEVTPEARMEMIREDKVLENVFDEIERRMNNLNQRIIKIPGLGPEYQIGASYFLKLKNYVEKDSINEESWNSLWENHLVGLLSEYLRGMPERKRHLEQLRGAFFENSKIAEKELNQNE